MFIPLSQQWMAGHGSLEISLERPLGASTWIERVVVYSRSMHAIKALSSVKFGTMPRSAQGLRKRFTVLEALLADLWQLFGPQPAGSKPAYCGARWEVTLASLGPPDPKNLPGLAEARTIADISQLLVRGQAIEAPGIEVQQISADHYFRPLQHAMACAREQRIFSGRAANEGTFLQCCAMADLQSMFGIYNPELEDMYGKVQNVWDPPVRPPARSELRLLPCLAVSSFEARRGRVAPEIEELPPSKLAILQDIVKYGCLVPHPRAKHSCNVSSRGKCLAHRGGLHPARETYLEAALVLYDCLDETYKRKEQLGEVGSRSLRPQNWWMEFVSHQRDRTLEEVFQRHDEGLAKTHEDERQARIRAWDEGRQAACERLLDMAALGIVLAKR